MRRLVRGICSSLSGLLFPLGKLLSWRFIPYRSTDRLDRGLILVLPGIEGESLLNQDIALGLVDAGIGLAIEIHDWTTGWFPLALFHLRSRTLHAKQSRVIADRVVVGHSGGGALAVLALEELPEDVAVTSVVLLNAAISPGYNLTRALECVEGKIWNFRSCGDWFFLGLGTLLFGSVDGHHVICAGAGGFDLPNSPETADGTLTTGQLREIPWRFEMAGSFHFAGHVGCVNRVFVSEFVANVLAAG
ncbi:MAG: hypothetical protein NT069_23425 [Planctomycetota bacterium]|nr:hypothetical protein [Planctomycetota bacterium]